MLRRILIIILVAVVIVAAIFAIQRFLNRDSGEAETPTDDTAAVVEDGEGAIDEGAVDEAPVTEDSGAVEQPSDAAVDTGESPEGYPAPSEGTVDTAPAEDTGEAPVAEGGTDTEMGGEAGGEDPNAGGGVPAEGAETEPALGDTVAVEPGEGGLPAISQPIAFVQPGVPTQHSVDNLEWLTQLARCYGTTVADIQAANNYACPDLIHPGWVVNISNPGNAGTITINEQPCFNYHTVQQGETLYSIANQFGIHYQWLARINAIYNYNYIYAGQQLVIPNPVDPIFTQPPAEPFFYTDCWYCTTYPVYPVPYGQ